MFQKLEPDQLQTILGSPCSQTPLWLYLVCEELRVYGDFRTLTSHVKLLTSSLEAVIKSMLERVISEDDTGYLEKVCLWFFAFCCKNSQ